MVRIGTEDSGNVVVRAVTQLGEQEQREWTRSEGSGFCFHRLQLVSKGEDRRPQAPLQALDLWRHQWCEMVG
jgi:hypothetical protein